MNPDDTLTLLGWRTPATAYPEAVHGRVRIRRVRYAKGVYDCYGVPDASGRTWRYYRAARRLPVTTLQIRGRTWMVDDPPHYLAMLEHARHYHGDVLVAGLGLGLIVHALDARPEVRSITVVERDADVIALVRPYLPQGKLRVLERDWHGEPVAHPAGGRWDGVFFDLLLGDGHALFPAAFAALLDMRRVYPGAVTRVHGFQNDGLNCMVADVEKAHAKAEAEFRARLRTAAGRAAEGRP